MVPAGFERLLLGHAVAIARSDVAAGVRRALVHPDGSKYTLHEYAARHPGARLLQGRGAAYAVALPHTPFRVVVRHNRHGGALARVTGDRFIAPTRAPYELEVSIALAHLGIPTPEVIAYALYPPGGWLQRSDVCSREVTGGRDLAQVLTGEGTAQRAEALACTATLVGTLSAAGARHADLNAKNVLLAGETAYVLDVDRVRLRQRPDATLAGNLDRLARSLRKWRETAGARVTDDDIIQLAERARATAQALS
ncbi:MAG TPA: lipopolysaccharide kinase InaA family protein [Gemmatimonadaceae bacterium]|nr:lipopolysaccharide kinase InaA family protein [Gemmatimonadaceae bacterium]